MAVIEKKIWPKFFALIESGKKKYDVRINDFDAQEGDEILFKEFDPETKTYTGREVRKKITYTSTMHLNDGFYPKEEFKKNGLRFLSLE